MTAASVGNGSSRSRAEELVPRLAALACALGRDPRELRDVRPGGEDERLAGEDETAPVARAEPVEHAGQRQERLRAEGVRLAPVGAVVDRHQGDGADARREPLQVELCYGLGIRARPRRRTSRQPWRGFSQRSAAPIPSPMQSAVSP